MAALGVSGLWEEVYETFFKVALVPSHPLNAEQWLDEFLLGQPLVNRDAYLSRVAFKSYDRGGAVKSLLDASLTVDIMRWPGESRRLAGITLGWLTSCADRRVRDRAAKGLVRLLVADPALAAGVARVFGTSDDDYILESIVESTYAACLIARENRSAFLPALDALVSKGYDRPNVIIRDSIQMLAQLLAEQGIRGALKKRLKAFPSRSRRIKKWPTLPDAKPLLDLEHLPTDMKLWGDQIGPDFWRYQVESRVRAFDMKSASITKENIACWLMTETLRLGYPGFKKIGLGYDRAINSEFGSGRGRKAYAERLGKKYYWISLHRLLGHLADHVTPAASFDGDMPKAGHFWSVEVRKRDLTDMRDITPEPPYPDSLVRDRGYAFPPRDSDVKKWVIADDFSSHDLMLSCTDASGVTWGGCN